MATTAVVEPMTLDAAHMLLALGAPIAEDILIAVTTGEAPVAEYVVEAGQTPYTVDCGEVERLIAGLRPSVSPEHSFDWGEYRLATVFDMRRDPALSEGQFACVTRRQAAFKVEYALRDGLNFMLVHVANTRLPVTSGTWSRYAVQVWTSVPGRVLLRVQSLIDGSVGGYLVVSPGTQL